MLSCAVRQLRGYVHEARFMKLLTEQTEDGSKRRNAARKKELEAAEKRIAELSAIFKRLYEDSVTGRMGGCTGNISNRNTRHGTAPLS